MKRLAVLAVTLLLFLGAPVLARAATLSLSPSSGQTGTSVSASGSGFGKRLTGMITFGTTQVQTFQTKPPGRFSTSFRVPSGYSGPTKVTAKTSAASATATFNVTSPPPPPPRPQCSDGRDNDGDGLVDYPADPGCTSASDNDETDPATSGDRTYSWGFDQPNCANNLWGTEPWVSNPCSDRDWNTQGIFYSVPDSNSPSGTNVLVQDQARVDSISTEQAWLHNPLTASDGTWGSEHRVDVVVKPVRWGSVAQSICSWAGGPKIFMGRPIDAYETSTYTIELSICGGQAYIQKKSWGIDDCGKDPRAVDCGAGGTWYNLETVNVAPASFGVWHTYTGIKRDNPDGSVTLIGLRDGVELLRYTEVPGSISLGPLRGGREGWRSNAIDWHMDSYKVTVKP